MVRSEAELEKRSQEADAIIADLTAKIEQIKAMGKLPPNIQETILKQENAQLRFNFKNIFSCISKTSFSENKSMLLKMS